MNNNSIINLHRKGRGARAFTLLEMIGTLAVIAILASVLVPVLIRQVDKAVSDQETATLQNFATAFQNSVLRNRTIPGAATWTNAIATEVGKSTTDVLLNPRNQSRLFLIDSAGFSPLTLPYTQTSSGASLPSNPRVMIVSGLGPSPGGNLPSMSSTPSATDFNNLWNSAVGTVPTTGAWAGWSGKPTDVIVQRINLAPLFVHLLLAVNNSTSANSYVIDSSTTNTSPVGAYASSGAYYLQNTVLNLYSGGVLDSQQILNSDSYFVYDQNLWRSSIASVGNSSLPDFSSLATAFVNSPQPTGSGAPTRQQVVNDMIAYMNDYVAWANAGFPNASSATYVAALAAYNTLSTDVNNLVNASSP